MPRIPEDILRTVQREITDAGHGGKSAVVADWTERLNCSAATLRRQLTGVRPATAPRKRSPREVVIPWEWIEEIAQLKIRVSDAGLEARELSTAECIKVLTQAGVIPAGALTVTTANRRLEEIGFRDEDPKVRVETSYANQVWQMDFSRSKYVQVLRHEERLDGTTDYILRISGRHLHYKESGTLRNLWMVQAKDTYSRLRLSRAYVATGETCELGWTFLDWCFARPEDDHPMRGIPTHLKVDQGAFGKHHSSALACEAYRIDLRLSKPYNKDSQGQVENAWRQIWQQFEMALVARYDTGYTLRLSEYNELLHAHLVEDGQKRHPSRPSTDRTTSYRSTFAAHPLREVTPGVYQHVFRVEERTIKPEQRVRIDNGWYSVPREVDGVRLKPGQRIRLMVNLDGEVRGQGIDVWTPYFDLGPWEASAWDDFTGRAPSTWRQQQADEVGRRRKAGTALPGANRPAVEPAASRVLTLPPRREHVEPESPFTAPAPVPAAQRPLTEHEARVRIGERLVALGFPTGYAAFAEQLGPHVHPGITAEQVDAILDRLSRALRKTA